MAGASTSLEKLVFNIRLAKYEDIPALVDMGEHFYEEDSRYKDIKPFNRDAAAKYAEELVSSHYFLIAEHEGTPVGMAAAYISGIPINPDILCSSEVVFYVEPAYRGSSLAVRLAMELEDVVLKNEDVDVLCMSALDCSPAVVDKLYTRMGYSKTETAYMKARSV